MQDLNAMRQEHEFRAPDGRTPDGAPVKSAAQARQGVVSGRVLTILAVGLVLVVLGFVASYVGAL